MLSALSLGPVEFGAGDSSPVITLGYYAHFMPEAGSKGRTAIDGLLGKRGEPHAGRNSPDSPQGR
ncbi:hypothetical protein G3I71_30015 [Streptomyces sp. SID12501]|uniref:Uncharacterized protein n=1 Tax=Streptomyces sp. SID12501 TaxID=2706042 RepID=A0A6B3BZR6_9ACTN|nr:hypothetical protein [Streptomyces sp. SID12501]